MASLPPPAGPPQPTPDDGRFARRMARVDGCPECVVNSEAPSAVYDDPTPPRGFLANYVCQSCGHAWTTSWSDA